MEDPSVAKTRKRKTAALVEPTPDGLKISRSPAESPLKIFSDLTDKLQEAEAEFGDLQKEIREFREIWQKEKVNHDRSVVELQNQEEAGRQRRQEEWAYEFSQKEKRALEEFNEKKAKWENDLEARKAVIDGERKELTELRQRVEKFDGEKERAVKEAAAALAKELNEKYQNETRWHDQATAGEKELLNLKIAQLTVENTRLTKELETTKKSLDEASRQLKEVALKVIEAGGGGSSARVSGPSSHESGALAP